MKFLPGDINRRQGKGSKHHPDEFEEEGELEKHKKWRRSIKHMDKELGRVIEEKGLPFPT